ncbi:MAG: HAD hydrolase-like protein [Oscillospiraceae bacterium]|nr:HAD hydrolase-like protein [Oscillospiraceae bacterium]
MYQTILFDFDGTVFDTVEGIAKSVRYALRRQGRDAELSELRRFAGPPLQFSFMEYTGLSEAEALRAIADFRERYLPVGVYESRPFPGIAELLDVLRAAGKTVGVATSKPQPLAELLLERSGLREKFDVVRGSDPSVVDNEKWQVLSWAMADCGADPASTVLVGDTRFDVDGARRCGIPCLGVRWGYAAAGELERAGAAAIAEDLEELKTLLLA